MIAAVSTAEQDEQTYLHGNERQHLWDMYCLGCATIHSNGGIGNLGETQIHQHNTTLMQFE